MCNTYFSIIGFVLIFLGSALNYKMSSRLNSYLSEIYSVNTLNLVFVYSMFPYVLLSLSILLLINEKRISFWILILSIAMPIFNIFSMTVFFQSAFDSSLATMLIGASPLISLLAFALLFFGFKKRIRKGQR